uniref:Predicted protein n=1 Tax=Hordeum vulgare subsp. vulgare TaxID=112509 RepID=F2DC33_HORVV|nr:predicted protein [Hordeum vulgare subsp. vulgare]BAK08296.1 predicted protein [Hordeum vulgare subsp. vulgare]
MAFVHAMHGDLFSSYGSWCCFRDQRLGLFHRVCIVTEHLVSYELSPYFLTSYHLYINICISLVVVANLSEVN